MLTMYSALTWEIIIVDDASPDGTQEVARQLQRLYGEDKVVCPGSYRQHLLANHT
jgi:glycosyltransferase involved in cell wall biosynthesis